MRVFIGTNEVANITSIYAKAFHKLGYKTLTAVIQKNPFYLDSEYDIILNSDTHKFTYIQYVRRAWLFQEALLSCDIFLFTYASILPRYIDIPLLKSLGKKIIFAFWGSEIRYLDFFEAQMREIGVLSEYEPFIQGMHAQTEEPLVTKLKRIQIAERYSDLILSQPGYGQLQTRPYMRANIPIDLELYKYYVPARIKPIVVHAPSNPLTKGSDIINIVVEELWQEGYEFDFRQIEKMPNSELKKILTDADIVLDELYGDTIGMFSTEAMATGNLVLTHYPATFAKIPADCPVVNITQGNLKDQLRRAIVDVQWRCELAQRGRRFVEQNHNHVSVVDNILKWLELGTSKEYDFIPEQINSVELKKLIDSQVEKNESL